MDMITATILAIILSVVFAFMVEAKAKWTAEQQEQVQKQVQEQVQEQVQKQVQEQVQKQVQEQVQEQVRSIIKEEKEKTHRLQEVAHQGMYKVIETYGELIATLKIKEIEHVKTIQKQQDQIDRMEGSLKRILEGLYDWETQAPVHTHEIELLMGFPLTRENGFTGTETWLCDIDPTTQQGFRLEKRIVAMEAKMARLV
jgi:hypothetical protein